MTHIKEIKQALEALEMMQKFLQSGWNDRWLPASVLSYEQIDFVANSIESLRQAIATEESSATQEPVAWIDEFGNAFPLGAQRGPKYLNKPMKPLYTHPQPKREWVGLTDEDKQEYVNQDFGGNRLDAMDWAEKRLKEKNT